MTFRTTSKRGWSMEWGVQLRPNGASWLPDNSNIYFLFFTMRTGPFSKCENRSDSQMGCQVRTWAVLTGRISPLVRTFNPVLFTVDNSGSHWEPGWKPVPVFNQWVRTTQQWKLLVLGSSCLLRRTPGFGETIKERGRLKRTSLYETYKQSSKNWGPTSNYITWFVILPSKWDSTEI
jgi:hypothetical protein